MLHRASRLIPAFVCLTLAGCGSDQLAHGKRYDKPMTYEQASTEKDVAFPLPPSAHNIYYGVYGEWQAYTMIARFDAPTQDCLKHIDTVLAWDDNIYKRTSSYP